MLGDRFAEVVHAARSGDVAAFGELWRATQPMLLRYLRVRAGDHAEDVASQTWIHVIEGLATFTGDEPGFRRWVVTIGRNTHIDLLRRLGRRPEYPVGDPSEVPDEPTGPDPASVAEARMSTAAALELVRRLPPEQAEMVTLRILVGMDVAEVAALVGRSPGAVRVAVHRGLKRLREQLLAEAPGPVTVAPPETLSGRDG